MGSKQQFQGSPSTSWPRGLICRKRLNCQIDAATLQPSSPRCRLTPTLLPLNLLLFYRSCMACIVTKIFFNPSIGAVTCTPSTKISFFSNQIMRQWWDYDWKGKHGDTVTLSLSTPQHYSIHIILINNDIEIQFWYLNIFFIYLNKKTSFLSLKFLKNSSSLFFFVQHKPYNLLLFFLSTKKKKRLTFNLEFKKKKKKGKNWR